MSANVAKFSSYCLLFLISYPSFSQQSGVWKLLSETRFESIHDSQINYTFKKPLFSTSQLQLQGDTITAEGYLVILKEEERFIALSKTPFNACFFCGKAGPETVLGIQLLAKPARLKIDQKVRVRGILQLNSEDPFQLPFTLLNAQILE